MAVSYDRMLAEGSLKSKLEGILNDPTNKKVAAKQLSARIHEINRKAKSTTDCVERMRLYRLKAELVLFGEEHDLGVMPVSWEWDARSKCAVILYRLSKGTVHLLSTCIRAPIDLRRLPRRETLIETRRNRWSAHRGSLNLHLAKDKQSEGEL